MSASPIASRDGRGADLQRLYRKAIEVDPEMTVAYINLALELEWSGKKTEAIKVYDTALQTAPFDVDLIRNGFFLRKQIHGDKIEAMRFLEKWQGKVGNLDYDFDFVRGVDAEVEGDYAEAERFYESAIAKDAPFAVYERLANLRLTKLSDNTTPNATRIAYVTKVMEPMLQGDGKAEAYLYVGRMLRDRFGAGRYAIDYLVKAFDITPTAEAAGEAFTQMAVHDFSGARAFLEKADRTLPDNYALKNDLARMHYQFLPEPDRAGELALAALELAPHDAARLDAIRNFVASRRSYGRFGEAHAFLVEKLKQEWSPAIRHKLLGAAVENSIAAQEFVRAKTYLDLMEGIGEGAGDQDAAWVSNRIALVDTAVALEATRGPAGIDGGYSTGMPNVLFGLNSDTIPASGYGELDRLAATLKSQEANAPVLSIEGYTDRTGSFATNEALSYRRANAVRDYLISKQGISPEKLRLAAHGSRFPAASNNTLGGRRQNRRVEIWPATADAQAMRPPALKGNTFAANGRHAVFGNNPPHVWDMRFGTGLAKLYRGRNLLFSPDGRYVSAISSYKEEGGETTETVYIYDAASGRVVAQLHEPLEVSEQAWRPDSMAIAFATGDGFLKIYDLATRTFMVARMGPVRIGGPLVWLADGRTVATGQHRMEEIVLWDAKTLEPTRRFGGVNWPHAIGASPDGRHLIAFDNRMTMSVWDLRGGDKLRQMKVPMIPLDLRFHPERPWVVFNAKFEASEVSLAVMDFKRMRKIARWDSGGTYTVGLSRDGETVTAIVGDREIQLSTATLQIVEKDVDP